MAPAPPITQTLLALSHDLGAESRALAILGEGNTSARVSEETFLVKASGSSLGALAMEDLVECRFAPVLSMLDRKDLEDHEIDDTLFAARIDSAAKKPSVETLFHADLLSLPGVSFVGHTHPVSVNRILCSPRAEEFAQRRLFPDQVVCCGAESVFVPYFDPGLKLAQGIRRAVAAHLAEHGAPPRLVLLASHGLIALGTTPRAVAAATYMADKAARIFLGAAALGGPVFLAPEDVHRLANRADEHHRQRALQL